MYTYVRIKETSVAGKKTVGTPWPPDAGSTHIRKEQRKVNHNE